MERQHSRAACSYGLFQQSVALILGAESSTETEMVLDFRLTSAFLMMSPIFAQNNAVPIPEDALALLRERFLTRCRDQVAILTAALDSGCTISGETGDGLLTTVHSLAGAGGTFGFPAISARACELETLLIEHTVDADATRRALQALISEMEERLA